MRPDDVRAELRIQPFQPFRIRLSNGKTYDVPHPDLVMGRSVVNHGRDRRPRTMPGGPLYDTLRSLSLCSTSPSSDP